MKDLHLIEGHICFILTAYFLPQRPERLFRICSAYIHIFFFFLFWRWQKYQPLNSSPNYPIAFTHPTNTGAIINEFNIY